MKKRFILIDKALAIIMLLTLVLELPLWAQEMVHSRNAQLEKPVHYHKVSVHDLAWLEGSWTGTGLGGQCQEVWEKPTANTMMGMFKLTKNDKPVFYEFFILLETPEGIELRLKHFDPSLAGWEPKDEFVTFKLVKVAGQKAIFEGLTFEKTTENELHIFVDIKYNDGNTVKEFFKFQKKSKI